MLYVNSFVAVFKVKQFSVVKNIHSEFFLIYMIKSHYDYAYDTEKLKILEWLISGARVFRGADCMMCFNGHPYKKGMP